MILVVLIGAGLGGTMHTARIQHASVAAIESAGGFVLYECDFDPGRRTMIPRPRYLKWLARRVGIDYLSNVVEIMLLDDLSDAELALIGRFPRLERIEYCGSHDSVSDAGLSHLNGLARLKRLDLSGSGITDAGLVHLKGMESLQELDLSGTGITDAALKYLSGLSRLRTLSLRNTMVDEAGVVHLKKLTNLRELDLWGTAVDDFGAQELRRALPKVQVIFESIMAR
jgi:internalin A